MRKDLHLKVSATDEDNDTLSFSAFNLPPGAEFDSLTGTFKWMPLPQDIGEYTGVHFEVSDGEEVDSEDITITINITP